jgi:energy-coupling factor transporter ATP-binding protein EcfA2
LQNLTFSSLKPQTGLLFKNGYYCSKTRVFTSEIPTDEVFLWGLPFNYEKNLMVTNRLNNWLGFLTDYKDTDREIIRLLFAQILGLAPDLNAVFLLAGEAGSGKSTLFNLAAKIVGLDLVTGTSIRNWDKFTVANVVKQRLVTFSDIGVSTWKQESFLETLKTMSGRDPMSMRVMYSQVASKGIYNGAVLVISNFTTVLTGDSGIRRRLLPIYTSTVPSDPIPNYVELLAQDLPNFVSWILAIPDCTLTNPWKTLELKVTELQSDPLIDFFCVRVVFSENSFVSGSQLYSRFKNYCLGEGYSDSEIVSVSVFSSNFTSLCARLAREKGLPQNFFGKERRNWGRGYRGIRLLEPSEWEDGSEGKSSEKTSSSGITSEGENQTFESGLTPESKGQVQESSVNPVLDPRKWEIPLIQKPTVNKNSIQGNFKTYLKLLTENTPPFLKLRSPVPKFSPYHSPGKSVVEFSQLREDLLRVPSLYADFNTELFSLGQWAWYKTYKTKGILESKWAKSHTTYKSALPQVYLTTHDYPRISSSNPCLTNIPQSFRVNYLKTLSENVGLKMIVVDLQAAHLRITPAFEVKTPLITKALKTESPWNVFVNQIPKGAPKEMDKKILKVICYQQLNGGSPLSFSKNFGALYPEKFNNPKFSEWQRSMEDSIKTFSVFQELNAVNQMVSTKGKQGQLYTPFSADPIAGYTMIQSGGRKGNYEKRASHKYISRVLAGIEVVIISVLTKLCAEHGLAPVSIEHDGLTLFCENLPSRETQKRINEQLQEFTKECFGVLTPIEFTIP